MKLLRVTTLAVLTSIAMGCSNIADRAKPDGSFEYVNEQQDKALSVPQGLNQPQRNADYLIVADQTNGAVGERIDIRAPRLVLPMISGTHIEEGSQRAKLWFDQVDDKRALTDSIWQAVDTFLTEQNIAVESKQSDKLVTDWVDLSTIEEQVLESGEDQSWISSFFGDDQEQTVKQQTGKQKFQFTVESKPHGRTAALVVDMLAEQDNSEAISQRNLETTMLNAVVLNFFHQQRIEKEKLRRQSRQGITMRLGFDSNGEAAYIVNADFERTWSRLPIVFRNLGFDVKDLDKSNAIYYVKYSDPDSGWFDFSGESELKKKGIEEKKYRFQLGDLGDKTSIRILDDESKAISNAVFTAVFDIVAEKMKQDDLDI